MSDADLLTLQQWLSPAFPVGGYAWSQGLETAMDLGRVSDRESLKSWLETVIGRGAAAADAALLASALDPDADLEDLAELARAMAGSAERLAETETQGGAFTSAHNALTGSDNPPFPLPIALGRAAQDLDLAPATILAAVIQAQAANLISAAVRFMPLGAAEGQALLAELRPLILDTAARAAETPPEKIGLSQPGADLMSFRHETQKVRIFRS
ncbi:MAG: urease accessory UreF family protein [Pseudomonadota bacterium]